MFFSSSRFDLNRELGDLSGKVFLVTGAYSGIGYETTKQLATHGAMVYLACRTKDKAEAAIAQLEQEVPKLAGAERLRFIQIDLGDMHSVKRAADEFLARETRLDVLVHNAGRMPLPYELSKDGVELTIAVNHLAVAVLTDALMPILKATAEKPNTDVRVVVVSSQLYAAMPRTIKLDSLTGWNDYAGNTAEGLLTSCKRYGTTKCMNILWVSQLQKKLDVDGAPITALALHPGTIATNAVSLSLGAFIGLMCKWFGITPEEGAYTTLFASCSKTVVEKRDEFKGKYLEPFGKITKPTTKVATDENLAQTLWDTTKKIASDILF